MKPVNRKARFARQSPLYIMLIPAIIVIFIYHYVPLFGLVIAFQNFIPARGFLKSEFVGLENFKFALLLPNTFQVIWNTLYISTMKIIAGIVFPIIIALMLNEVVNRPFKRTVQTIIYLPYFLSWVVLAGVLVQIMSPSSGLINQALMAVGLKPVYFLGSPPVFPFTLVFTDLWKELGFKAIVYLATLTGISPGLYEAARIDGAGRIAQTRYITLPSMTPIVVLMTTLALGQILNAGFEQVYNLYNPSVFSTGDIIDTLVYRIGIQSAQFGLATAIGMFKSVVSCIMVTASYYLAKRLTGYTVF